MVPWCVLTAKALMQPNSLMITFEPSNCGSKCSARRMVSRMEFLFLGISELELLLLGFEWESFLPMTDAVWLRTEWPTADSLFD
jgi:hypothetical protein